MESQATGWQGTGVKDVGGNHMKSKDLGADRLGSPGGKGEDEVTKSERSKLLELTCAGTSESIQGCQGMLCVQG